MNISTVGHQQAAHLFSVWERAAQVGPLAMDQAAQSIGDTLSLRRPARLLDDEEATTTLEETLWMIRDSAYDALGAHSGLDAGRVATLLA